MADDFDFNNYSKYSSMPKEEAAKIAENILKYVDSIREERRKTYYSLPNDESKLNFIRKALINSVALISLLDEFLLLPYENNILEGFNSSVNKEEVSRLESVFHIYMNHVAEHTAQFTGLCDLLLYWKKEDKKREEEINALKEMMK